MITYYTCSVFKICTFPFPCTAPAEAPLNVRVSRVRGTTRYQVSWDLPPNNTWNGPRPQHQVCLLCVCVCVCSTQLCIHIHLVIVNMYDTVIICRSQSLTKLMVGRLCTMWQPLKSLSLCWACLILVTILWVWNCTTCTEKDQIQASKSCQSVCRKYICCV